MKRRFARIALSLLLAFAFTTGALILGWILEHHPEILVLGIVIIVIGAVSILSADYLLDRFSE